MGCAHVLQGQERPPHHGDVLGAWAQDTKFMGLWDGQMIVTSSHRIMLKIVEFLAMLLRNHSNFYNVRILAGDQMSGDHMQAYSKICIKYKKH